MKNERLCRAFLMPICNTHGDCTKLMRFIRQISPFRLLVASRVKFRCAFLIKYSLRQLDERETKFIYSQLTWSRRYAHQDAYSKRYRIFPSYCNA